MKSTRDDRGNTMPGELHEDLPSGLGKAKPREPDQALAELAKKVAARHSGDGGGYGIERDASGHLRTTKRPA